MCRYGAKAPCSSPIRITGSFLVAPGFARNPAAADENPYRDYQDSKQGSGKLELSIEEGIPDDRYELPAQPSESGSHDPNEHDRDDLAPVVEGASHVTYHLRLWSETFVELLPDPLR